MKKGFTVIELLVVLAIIAVLAALLYPVFGRSKVPQPVFPAQVIRKYDVQHSLNRQTYTVLHVDVKRKGSSTIEPLTTESYEVFANLLENKWYDFHTTGVRDTKWDHFPMIVSVDEITDPNQ